MSKKKVLSKKPEGRLAQQVKALPLSPGIYVMRNSDNEVIYIGKAKNLRARVRSYFSGTDTRLQIEFLLNQVHSIDTVVTENERQALIMESDLIKKYRPHYNVRLKDDKAHLIVRVDLEAEWPRLELVRRIEDDGALYIGPYAFAYEIRGLLDVVRRTLPLRTCLDTTLRNRVRPCLEYQIKRCVAPCCLPIDREEYLGMIYQAVDILKGKNREVVVSLERQMALLSSEMKYEEAAVIRDRIALLEQASREKFAPDFGMQSQDAVGLYREGKDVSLAVLLVRNGRLFESKTFQLSDVEIPDDEILGSVLSQLYQHRDMIPTEVLLPFELEDVEAREDLYSEVSQHKVKISVPERGAKRRLLELAEQNARESFRSQFDLEARDVRLLESLRTELELPEIPRIIDCVDISHFQGGETVGAVVSFKDGKPDKSRYRRFILRTVQGKPDDFASMYEVLTRHLSRQAEENTLPDLLVIDGGAGQLSEARKVKRELSLLTPTMVALAKERVEKLGSNLYLSQQARRIGRKPERVYLEDSKFPIILKETSDTMLLLQRIRDEAHRFVITFHRASRSKRMFSKK